MYIPGGASGKENPPANAGGTRDAGWIPGVKDPLGGKGRWEGGFMFESM